MSNEILGNCYEVITELAIADYSSVLLKDESIYAQQTPVGIGIVPDILIGKSLEKPRILLQVHHTRAERASEKKFWRNVGEYVDARNALGPDTLIVTITFDSGQKRRLSAAATHLMDGFLEVDRESYGPELLKFAKVLEAQIKINKVKEEDRLALARTVLKGVPNTVAAIRKFAKQLNATLSGASKAGASWFATYSVIQKARSASRVPNRKVTTLRRGLGRFLPVDDQGLLLKLLKSVRTGSVAPWPKYASDVGVVTKSIGGAKFKTPSASGAAVSRKMESDPAYEVYRMTENFDDATLVNLWKKLREATVSLAQACASIREVDDFKLYHKFVVDNYDRLICASQMARALQDCFKDPDYVLGAPIGLRKPDEKGVWLFDYVMTLIKAKTGKQQGYGYTRLDDESRTNLGTGIGPHLSNFVSRGRPLRLDLLDKFSRTLSVRLKKLTKKWVQQNAFAAAKLALSGRFEDGVYKSSKFDPVHQLLSNALPSAVRNTRTATYLTGFVGKGAATCDALRIGDTLIMWQSSSAGHPADKHKELMGRIGMLRVKTGAKGKVVAAGFRRAILVLDGTWQQDQLLRMAKAGFDAIYYADEIPRLVRDLNSARSGSIASKVRRKQQNTV